MNYQNILEKHTIYISAKDKMNFDILEKAFEIEFTHNSTAIEGNTLTLLETKVLLEDGMKT